MEQAQFEEAMGAIKILRSNIETYGVESSEFKGRADVIEAALAKFDEEKQKDLIAVKNAEKNAKELEDRVKTMELEVAKGGAGKNINYKEQAPYKALNNYAKYGEKGLNPEEIKVMRMDDNTTGGALTTTEMDPKIIEKMTEVSAVRSVAIVKTVSKKTLEMATEKTIPEAYYEGEAEQGQLDQMSYGTELETAYRITITVPFSLDLLNDSNFDLESEINKKVSKGMGKKEGKLFVLGNSVKQPEGFLVNAAVVAGAKETIGSGVIVANDMTLLTGELPVGYDPLYTFNRKTLSTLRTFATTTGMYVWQAGLAAAAPNTINGENYIVLPDMPDIAVGNLPVVYADFSEGYQIIDRTGMTIIRDEVTGKRKAVIEITFHRYNTGKVILPEAFIALKVKA
jgi:HK97 family phage major capsid protein